MLPSMFPPGPPDPWIDKLADQVEIARLLSMGVFTENVVTLVAWLKVL